MTAFSGEKIRALVKRGKYCDGVAEQLLGDVLNQLRDKIGKTCLVRSKPIVNPSPAPSGVLAFENEAVKAGVARDPQLYRVAWSDLDINRGSTTPIGETESTGWCIQAWPQLIAKAGEYVAAAIRAVAGANESWSIRVRSSLLRLARGWKLVGLESAIMGRWQGESG